MTRIYTFLLLSTALIGWGFTHRPGVPFQQYTGSSRVNSINPWSITQVFPVLSDWNTVVADSVTSNMRVLLLDYSAYDHGYAEQMRLFVERALPGASVNEFWEGNAAQLTSALANQQAVVIPYPADGNAPILKSYGTALEQYIQKGGEVIFAGTHSDVILRQFGLIDIDYVRSVENPSIALNRTDHPLVAGLNKQFSTQNFAYSLDVSDPNFVSLAEVRGAAVVGYKNIGQGRVIYLGLEYYDDELPLAMLLANALRMALPAIPPAQPVVQSAVAERSNTPVRRNTEILYAGSSKNNKYNAKVYPNPYVDKASLEIEVQKSALFTVEMTDELGRVVAILLPQRQLIPGTYRLDLPSVDPGVYFVQCQGGDQTEVRKVVKLASK